jgi:hypothetical protein
LEVYLKWRREMKLPIVCFNKKDLEEVEKSFFKDPEKSYVLSMKETTEGEIIIYKIKDLGKNSKRRYCYPVMPEDCSNCSRAESHICSRWWQGEWSNDRPEIDEDLYDFDNYEPEPEKPEDPENNNSENVFSRSHYCKVWSKKYPIARTLALLGTLKKDEHLFRTALVLVQLGVEDIEWAKRVWISDVPWQPEFLPEVVEIPQNRREVKIFKKSLSKILKDTKEIAPSVRGIWISFISGHLAEKWGLSQDILESWLGKILTKI